MGKEFKNCTLREELAFCNATHPPTPGPVSKKCEEVLAKDCASARRTSQRDCDECVRKLDAGKRVNCTRRDAMVFCGGGPGPAPGPVSEKCERLLKADCPEKPELLCDKCTEKKGGRS